MDPFADVLAANADYASTFADAAPPRIIWRDYLILSE